MDVKYQEGLIAVRAKLKKGRMRYVPMTLELGEELRQFPRVLGRIEFFRRRQERSDLHPKIRTKLNMIS